MISVETLEGLHTRARDLHSLARRSGGRRRGFLRDAAQGLPLARISPFVELPWGPQH